MLRHDIPTGHVIYNIHTYLHGTYYNINYNSRGNSLRYGLVGWVGVVSFPVQYIP
jgi:hypothetical protein